MIMKTKPIKAWAVCFALSKKCLSGDIPTFTSKAKARKYIKELHQKIGGFEEDHHPVSVCKINKPCNWVIACSRCNTLKGNTII